MLAIMHRRKKAEATGRIDYEVNVWHLYTNIYVYSAILPVPYSMIFFGVYSQLLIFAGLEEEGNKVSTHIVKSEGSKTNERWTSRMWKVVFLLRNR